MLHKILVIAMALLSCGAYAQDKKVIAPAAPAKEEKIDYTKVGAPMPPIRLVTLDTLSAAAQAKIAKKKRNPTDTTHRQHITREYNEDEFANRSNLLVMIFNPNCGHCEDQTERFIKNLDMFNRTRFVMMCVPATQEYLPGFIKNHKVKEYDKITIGIDSSDFVKKTFLYSALPQINIYDRHRKLIKAYSGEVVIDSLRQYVD